MNQKQSTDIKWSEALVSQALRARVLGQAGCVVWLTGLSGSGKSTVARAVEKHLLEKGHGAFVLDGDNLRFGLNGDLGFSPEDRAENIRRTGEVAALFASSGMITLCAFISPTRAARARAAACVGSDAFFEVHVATPLEVCEDRDVKGLYAKARAGEINNFTGISAPYEPPEAPALRLQTHGRQLADCVADVILMLQIAGQLGPDPAGHA